VIDIIIKVMADKDQDKTYETLMAKPGIKESLAFLNNSMDPVLGKLKGQAFVYRMNPAYFESSQLPMLKMEHMQAVN